MVFLLFKMAALILNQKLERKSICDRFFSLRGDVPKAMICTHFVKFKIVWFRLRTAMIVIDVAEFMKNYESEERICNKHE